MKYGDADYFRDRAIQEQIAAQKANCEAARERHEELAAMYRFRAAMLNNHPSYCAPAPGSENAMELA